MSRQNTHETRCKAIVAEVRQEYLPSIHGRVMYTDGVAAYTFEVNGTHLVTTPGEIPLYSIVRAIGEMVGKRGFIAPGMCECHDSSSVLPNGMFQCDSCGQVF